MMKQNSGERERARIHAVAREYRGRGYEVTIEPSRMDLPDFLGDFRPDLIAKGRDETVVVEVKTRSSLSGDRDLRALSEVIDRKPGWRFELIVTNPRGEIVMSKEARVPNKEVLLARLSQADRLVGIGQLEASMLLAWSAAEGFLRMLGEREGLALEKRSSLYILKKLYSIGLLEERLYELLMMSMKIRNSLVHGLDVSGIDPNVIRELTNNIHRGLKETFG